MAGALAVIAINFKSPRLDSDILWSIATGQWIAANKAFPLVDSFSWTILGREWITHEWLYCFSAYYLHSLWGNMGLYILTYIPMVITIYVLYRICHNYDQHKTYTFLLTLTIGMLLLYLMGLPFRAYVYAVLFFTIMIYLMYFTSPSKWEALFYAVLFMLWANFHISVCMGIVILAVEMVRRSVITPRRQYLDVIVIGILATFINPYAYRLWGYFWFTLTSMGESMSIVEWQAPDFNNSAYLFLYLGLAVSMIILQFIFDGLDRLPKTGDSLTTGSEAKQASKAGWGLLSKWWGQFRVFSRAHLGNKTCLMVLFWGFYIYSLYSVRMIFYTIILWIIVSAVYVGNIDRLDFTRRTYTFLVGLFVVFGAANFALYNPNMEDIIEYNKKVSPVEEVDFLKDHPQYQYHLFNSYIFGGYLILNHIPVFIDARSDSYIKFGIQKQYGEIAFLEEDPQKALDESGIENVIINKNTPLRWYLSVNPQWSLVYEGATACIFTKSDG